MYFSRLNLSLLVSVAFSLLLLLLSGCQEKEPSTDSLAPILASAEQGQTECIDHAIDSLLALRPEQARIYGQLTRLYYKKAQLEEEDQRQANRERFRMCLYHAAGKQLDSTSLRLYYDSIDRNLALRFEKMAGSRAFDSLVREMVQIKDESLVRVVDSMTMSARRILELVERSSHVWLRQVERTLDSAINSYHGEMKQLLDSLEERLEKEESK